MFNVNLLGQVGRRTNGLIMGNFFSKTGFPVSRGGGSVLRRAQGEAADTENISS